uniref:Gustatory receptor n=1 Tax=Amphimedon queenslandica TaxID=400682 RepID=A0A1X7UL87_AMPQE
MSLFSEGFSSSSFTLRGSIASSLAMSVNLSPHSRQLSSNPNSSKVPEIVLRSKDDHDGDYLDREVTRTAVQPFNDLAKFTLLSICFSTFVSYLIFIIALIWHYFSDHFHFSKWRCDGYEALEDNEGIPHPFNEITCNCTCNDDDDDDDDDDSTEVFCVFCSYKLTKHFWFFFFLSLNIIFWGAMVVIFFYAQYHYGVHKETQGNKTSSKTEKNKKYEIASAALYFYSHLCTIVSCFIFSKIMYGIQRKINEQKKDITSTVTLPDLINDDKTFLKRATKALSIFQFWFFIHWIFYIVTSFLMIALSIEAILLHIRATQHHIQPGVHFSVYEIPLLIIWSISNVLMFIYPCFQAASITRARKKYIRHLMRDYAKTDQKEKVDSYVKYLQSRDFGFRLNIACIHIPFNLNVAYTSILIGVFGIVLSVLTTVAT